MNLGYHVSIAGGLHKAIDRGQELKCEAIQIFTTSPQSWNFNLPTKEDVDLFKKKWEASDIKNIIAHAIYLINLASENPYILNNSINSVISGLETADSLGLGGYVIHIGSHRGQGIEGGIKKAAKSLKQILSVYKGKVPLLLENNAGAGNLIGKNIQELSEIINLVKDERIGICLDTAHAFESGYDLRDKKGLDNILKEIDNKIGLKKLKALHINDSKTEFNSNRDRHENIGSGFLGLAAFGNIVNDKRLQDISALLETPDIKSDTENKTNLEILKGLRNG